MCIFEKSASANFWLEDTTSDVKMIENRGLGLQSEYYICTKKYSGKF